MSETPGEESGRRNADIPGLVIAFGLLCLAALCFWDVWELGSGPSYSQVGPAAASEIVGGGLIILAILNGLAAWRGHFIESEPDDLGAVLIMVTGFAVLIVIIWLGGGFIPGMTVIFAATTYAFGRRTPLLDLTIGFALALIVYLIFTKLLTLSLPAGPLERLF
jgi:putative tricarboxylic transport membrane protein